MPDAVLTTRDDNNVEMLILYPCGHNGDAGFSWVDVDEPRDELAYLNYGQCYVTHALMDCDTAFRPCVDQSMWVGF